MNFYTAQVTSTHCYQVVEYNLLDHQIVYPEASDPELVDYNAGFRPLLSLDVSILSDFRPLLSLDTSLKHSPSLPDPDVGSYQHDTWYGSGSSWLKVIHVWIQGGLLTGRHLESVLLYVVNVSTCFVQI